MANQAIQDIVSLGDSLSNLAQNITALRETRVRVSAERVSAQIQQDNYEFLQRFNLRPDDPNYIDERNWGSAVAEHEARLNEELAVIGDEGLRSQVQTRLAPSTSQFLLDVSNVMADKERAWATSEYLITLDTAAASQASQAGKLKAFDDAASSMSYVDGWLSPEQVAQRDKARAGLAGGVELERILSQTTARRAIKLDDKGEPVKNAEGEFEYEDVPIGMTFRMAAVQLEADRQSGALSEQEYQAAKAKNDAMQAQSDEQFKATWKDTFSTPAEKGLLSAESWIAAGQALAQQMPYLSPEAYIAAQAEYAMYGVQQDKIGAIQFADGVLATGIGGKITPQTATSAIKELNRRYPTASTSVAVREEVASQITRLSAAADTEAAGGMTPRQELESKYRMMKDLHLHQPGANITVADLKDVISDGYSAGIDVSGLLKAEEEFFAQAAGGPVTLDDLNLPASLQRIMVTSPELGIRQADVKAYAAWLRDPGKNPYSESVRSIDSIMSLATRTATIEKATKGGIRTQEQFDARVAELFARGWQARSAAAPFKTGVFGGEGELAAFQSVLDSGALDEFSVVSTYGEVFGLSELQTGAKQVRNRQAIAIKGMADAGVIPAPTTMTAVTAGEEMYWIAKDGRTVYSVNATPDGKGQQVVSYTLPTAYDPKTTKLRDIPSDAWSVIRGTDSSPDLSGVGTPYRSKPAEPSKYRVRQ